MKLGFDKYFLEGVLPILVDGLENLAVEVETIGEGDRDGTVTERFNPCLNLAQFLMRNNPKFGDNQAKYSNFGVMNMELKRRFMKDQKQKLLVKLREVLKAENEWKVDRIPEIFSIIDKLLKQDTKFENCHVS